MAELSKIRKNGIDYALKDTTAREAIEELKQNGTGNSGGNANQGLTAEQITALDGMFKVCAFVNDDVSAEYNAFKTAFGIGDSGEVEPDEPVTPAKTLTSISATYSGGDVPVGTAVSALTGIVVKAHYSDGSTATVTGYTLSGTIAEGSNTVTVTYQGKTATFTVTGVAEAVETWEEAMVLSYATSGAPSSSNNFTPTTTTNTGYANACSTNEVEHFGGVLHVEFEPGAFGFDMAIVLEDGEGTRWASKPSVLNKNNVSEDNTELFWSASESGTSCEYASNRTSKLPYTVKIPDGYKIACLFFRNMSDKVNIIAQNGITFTLKGA